MKTVQVRGDVSTVLLMPNMAPQTDNSRTRVVSSDTVYTKENGEYLYQNTITGYQNFRVVCEDLTGAYEADSMDIKMNPTGGSGWYEGKDNKEVNFELKKKEK